MSVRIWVLVIPDRSAEVIDLPRFPVICILSLYSQCMFTSYVNPFNTVGRVFGKGVVGAGRLSSATSRIETWPEDVQSR